MNLPKLNFPEYPFKVKTIGQDTQIFDAVRKKYVALTPEEWVRQNMVQYLICEKSFPASLLVVEMTIKYNQLQKRGDIVVFDRNGKSVFLVECKSTSVEITQKVFDQIARYNLSLNVQFLIVTNGLQHYCCQMDHHNRSYKFLEDIPDYRSIVK